MSGPASTTSTWGCDGQMTSALEREDETRLLEAARAGDQHAFAQLASASRSRLWAVCLQICGNPLDAEDALQDALISAWQHLDKFDGRARFSTWAYRIAANAALSRVRKRRDIPEEDAGLDQASTASAVADKVTTVIVVRRALADLPPDFREALVLREYAGLDYQEIATHQGIPVQTVKSRLNRARTALKAALVEAA